MTDFHKQLPLRQSEVNYTTVSPQTGEKQCANCKWFQPTGANPVSDGWIPLAACSIVEPYPPAILATGYCDKHKGLPMDASEPEPESMPAVDVEGDVERGYQSPVPVQAGMFRRLLGQQNPSATYIWRSASGLREGVIVTSNGYKDREEEHVATEALKEYVRNAYEDNGDWKGDNRFQFYHGIDIGEVAAAGVVTGFLVEIVQERPGIVPEVLWDYWQETSTDKSVQWGASHGFRAQRKDDTYVRIDKKETTVLDVADAANLATYSGVLPMTNESKHLDAAFAKRGIQDASKLIAEKGLNALVEELRKRGEVAKGKHTKAEGSEEADAPAEKAEGESVDFTQLITELLEVIANHQAELDTLKASDEAAVQEAEKRKKSADATASDVQTLKSGLEALKKQLADFKADTPRRASEDSSTQLSGDEEAKAKRDIEARTKTFDPMFPGMQVPLKEAGV